MRPLDSNGKLHNKIIRFNQSLVKIYFKNSLYTILLREFLFHKNVIDIFCFANQIPSTSMENPICRWKGTQLEPGWGYFFISWFYKESFFKNIRELIFKWTPMEGGIFRKINFDSWMTEKCKKFLRNIGSAVAFTNSKFYLLFRIKSFSRNPCNSNRIKNSEKNKPKIRN